MLKTLKICHTAETLEYKTESVSKAESRTGKKDFIRKKNAPLLPNDSVTNFMTALNRNVTYGFENLFLHNLMINDQGPADLLVKIIC